MQYLMLLLMTILLSLPSVALAQSGEPLKLSASTTPAKPSASASTKSSKPNSGTSSTTETACEVCKPRLATCSVERIDDGRTIAHLKISNAKLEKANGELRRRPSAKDGVAGTLLVTGALIATWGAARDTGGGEVHQPDAALIGAGSGLVVGGLVALFWPERR